MILKKLAIEPKNIGPIAKGWIFLVELVCPGKDTSLVCHFTFTLTVSRSTKVKKAWVYSMSSTCRKGTSISTKLVFILLREAEIIKGRSHDAVGKLVGYIVDTLMTGAFPLLDHEGNKFAQGSVQSQRAGQAFAGGWSMAFAGFKGDWEARAMVHKLTRYYRTTFICEHCMASYKDEFTFGDFRPNANSQVIRFSHDDFLMLNPPNDQSSWTCVKGWTKDRNLEEARCKNN